MTKYFAGQFAGQFNRNRTDTSDVTTVGSFDSSYVSSGIGMAGGTSAYIRSTDFSATGTVWMVFEFYKGAGGESNGAQIIVCRDGGTNIFRFKVVADNSLAIQPQYWNGSAWVDTGSTVNLSRITRHRIALRITLNTSFEMWLNGMSVSSGSGWTGGPTTMTHWYGYNYTTTANSAIYSQVLIADYDVRDAHLMTSAINGDSAANTGAASGSYTDVNENGVDDSTAISITGSGNKAGQTHAGITVPGGMAIGAMVISARGRVDGVITDGKLGVRSGGSNYSSSGLNFNSGYEPRQHIIETNPATGSPFSQSGFNAAEPYLEAA
jgi:hypothetical protein